MKAFSQRKIELLPRGRENSSGQAKTNNILTRFSKCMTMGWVDGWIDGWIQKSMPKAGSAMRNLQEKYILIYPS